MAHRSIEIRNEDDKSGTSIFYLVATLKVEINPYGKENFGNLFLPDEQIVPIDRKLLNQLAKYKDFIPDIKCHSSLVFQLWEVGDTQEELDRKKEQFLRRFWESAIKAEN
jgi:hypothetical protein